MTAYDVRNPPMMGCGHAANAAKHTPEGDIPVCVICAGIDPRASEVVEGPDLTGRVSRCSCGAEAPSGPGLPFFEYTGPGTYSAAICLCGFAEVAHSAKVRGRYSPSHRGGPCEAYRPRGDVGKDKHYCGHSGWD